MSFSMGELEDDEQPSWLKALCVFGKRAEPWYKSEQ
jgi:hypothetical protein